MQNTTDSCSYSTGIPGNGKCAGPLERTVAKRDALAPCPLNTISYIRDNSVEGGVLCGECEPGSAGWEDTRRLCGVNQYCNDDAKCVDISEHPLINAQCPYEVGGQTKSGWCGPGLRCVLHRCVVCTTGEHHSSLNLLCHNGQWVYDSPRNSVIHPELMIAPLTLTVCIVLFTAVLIAILIRRHKELRTDGNNRLGENIGSSEEESTSEGVEKEGETGQSSGELSISPIISTQSLDPSMKDTV